MEEFKKNCKYIFKVFSKNYKTMMTIKLTIVPGIIVLASFVASFYPEWRLPNWTWGIFTTLFMIMAFITYVIGNKMREMETPNIIVKFIKRKMTTPDMNKGIMDGQQLHQLFLEIENIASHGIIDSLIVKLTKITFDENNIRELNNPLIFFSRNNSTEISLNPKDTEQAFLGRYDCHEGKEEYHHLGIKCSDSPKITFDVWISSKSFTGFTKKFILLHGIKGEIFNLKEVQDEKG